MEIWSETEEHIEKFVETEIKNLRELYGDDIINPSDYVVYKKDGRLYLKYDPDHLVSAQRVQQ